MDGFIKTHYQHDQEELVKACGGKMWELLETERGVKSAASALIGRDILEKHRPDKDHFLIHCISMGATEDYGFNKNADGWSREALTKYHPTFVTHGHFFREHKNKDPKLKIGDIKYAAFDASTTGMKRVELLMHGSKKLAEKEYEMAKAGKELSFSMSAKVPYDVCDCCQNKAKNPSQYCSHMRNSPTQYLPEFRKYAFVDNPICTFFDNSSVDRPAERIARYLSYFEDQTMAKAASANRVILGHEWAELQGHVAALDPELRGWLEKLAAVEQELDTMARTPQNFTREKRAIAETFSHGTAGESWSDAEFDELRKLRPGTFFFELSKRACVLPFGTFAAYVLGVPQQQLAEQEGYVKSAGMLGGLMQALMGASEGCGGLSGLFGADSRYTSAVDGANNDLVQSLMDKADQEFGVSEQSLHPRVLQIVVHSADRPRMCACKKAEELPTLAKAYGLYLANALRDMQKNACVEPSESVLIAVLSENRKTR